MFQVLDMFLICNCVSITSFPVTREDNCVKINADGVLIECDNFVCFFTGGFILINVLCKHCVLSN